MSDELTQRHYLNAAITMEEMALVAALKPRVFIDGNAWCVLWGENLQDGVAGFGDTPMEAIYAFTKAMHSHLPERKPR